MQDEPIRMRAFDAARADPPTGASPDAAVAEVQLDNSLLSQVPLAAEIVLV
jgi:hypothetical protein